MNILLKHSPRREYRLRDGTLVPGVTTVIGELRKPALDKWHWQCGKDGVPWPIPTDGTAGVGTIAHYKIHCWLGGETPAYDGKWDKAHIEAADIPFKTFCDYYRSRDGVAILSEYSSVHEKQRYGGTLDLLVSVRDGVEIWDVKTSKAIYDEYWIQLAGYKALLDQNSKFRHVRIKPRVVLVTKDGRLDAPDISPESFAKAAETWKHLIKLYHKLNEFRRAT